MNPIEHEEIYSTDGEIGRKSDCSQTQRSAKWIPLLVRICPSALGGSLPLMATCSHHRDLVAACIPGHHP